MRLEPLRRHQLLRLTPTAWQRVLTQPWPTDARNAIAHWATHDLPLVVARQPTSQPVLQPDALWLGLPTPTRWGRQRLSLRVAFDELSSADAFPPLQHIAPPPADALATIGAAARVYGSHGWQHLTGLGYVHDASDLDLLLPAADAPAADAAAALLQRAPVKPRLDGELQWPDGSAVAWREWRAWRMRGAGQILVKRLHGVALESGTGWLERACRGAATACTR